MKECSHGSRKNYKILQKLVYVMITVNILRDLHCVAHSSEANESNTVRNMAFFHNLGCAFRDVLLISVLK